MLLQWTTICLSWGSHVCHEVHEIVIDVSFCMLSSEIQHYKNWSTPLKALQQLHVLPWHSLEHVNNEESLLFKQHQYNMVCFGWSHTRVRRDTPLQVLTSPYTYLPSHYITVTQFQYILTISIAWEFATN